MNTPERLLAILDMLASADEPCGLSELSHQLDVGKYAVLRILSALEDQGWLVKDAATKKYSLTGALAEIGFRVVAKMDIEKISIPYLYELQQTTGENSYLVTKVGLEKMFISFIPSKHELHQVLPVGKRIKLWYGASGKAILAFMAKDEIIAVINQLKRSEDRTLVTGKLVTVEALRKELAKIRRQGFAITSGERNIGILGVSAPIFNYKQQVAGCVGVSGPIYRFDKNKALQYSSLVMEKAKKISSNLGAKIE